MIETINLPENTFKQLIEEMNEGALTISASGSIEYCNPGFARLTGLSIEKIMGKGFSTFLDAQSKQSFDADLGKELVNKPGREVNMINAAGNLIPVLMVVKSLTGGGKASCIIITDLTMQKKDAKTIVENSEELQSKNAEFLGAIKKLAFQNDQKELRAAELGIANKELTFQGIEKGKRAAELIIANEELALQNTEREKRTEELRIANQDLSSFSYVSSHDLQDPLLKIQNYIVCILDEEKNLSETGKQYFLRIRKTTERMQMLIIDLLTYSRTKTIDHKFIDTNLNSVVDQVVADLEDEIREKKASIYIEELGSAEIIGFQFRQLFNNLIGNALKFIRPEADPVITIKNTRGLGSELGEGRLDPHLHYCHITISDNGIGFDEQYRERIFEVFQRLHTYEEFVGTGIGLAICKRIVEIHGGFISAVGECGKGSVFNMYFLQKHNSAKN